MTFYGFKFDFFNNKKKKKKNKVRDRARTSQFSEIIQQRGNKAYILNNISSVPIQALWGWRWIGSPFSGTGDGLYTILSWGINLSNLNLLTKLCVKTSSCNREYSFPGHILGPPPNGTYVYGAGPFPSNLLGSNFSGSGKYSGLLCVAFVFQHSCTINGN